MDIHDEYTEGLSKAENADSINNKLGAMEEKKDETALNFCHLSDWGKDCGKKALLTGRRSTPKLVSAQAVLSSRIESESIVQVELLPNVANSCRSREDTELKLNNALEFSENADCRKPNYEQTEKKQVQENAKEIRVLERKGTFATDACAGSRKSMWRVGQRERWKYRRKERLEGTGQRTEEEDQAMEINQEIKWEHIRKQWRSKERQDDNAEKDVISLSEMRGTAPHRILSMYSFASSSSSSSTSFNRSSAESDEVISEGEETGKRKSKKKCRSWRTFLTMLQWSKHRQNSWVQLAGHQGNIQPSEGGEVLKRFNEVEDRCLQMLMSDPLQRFVPQYYGNIIRNGEKYIRLEDLLSGLKQPAIMDCKIGIRTYQEDEIINARAKSSMRHDMYQKMVKVDPMAPTEEEHAQKCVTKLRYMQWRDNMSSTSTLGFRIEGIMMDNGTVLRDFNKTRNKAHVTEKLLLFTKRQLHILKAYLSRLGVLKKALMESAFFSNHEVIGGSLLFVHDCSTSKANVWMIDFGKTVAMPENTRLKHNVPWLEGNREDGYLIGLESLVSVLHEAIKEAKGQSLDNHQQQTEHSSDTVKQPQSELDAEASQIC